VRDHRIVNGVRVLGDVEILLDLAPRVREEGPVGADSAAKLIRLGDVVGAYRDEAAIADLELAVQLDEPFGLPPLLRTEAPATENEDHGIWALQLGERTAFRGVVGELVVGEDRTRNDVGSHMTSLSAALDLTAASAPFGDRARDPGDLFDQRAESAEVGDRGRRPLRRQLSERPLDDRVLDPESLGQSVSMPGTHKAVTSKVASSSTGVPSGKPATP
jgi:hypothetical protein